MTDDATVYGGIIDQRGMSTTERQALAETLRELWWDCHRDFVRPVVDLETLRLSTTTMHALAADLEEAGYGTHARIVRRSAAPRDQMSDRALSSPRHWRPRVHQGASMRAAHC